MQLPVRIYMRSWPRSVYVTIAALIVLFGYALYRVHTETREAYRAVGFNDGQINQREQTLNLIQRSVIIQDCGQPQAASALVDFLSVKADSVYLIVGEGNRVQFCRK